MPRDDEGGYEVGYGKPPRDTRFQRGQSGNPKGRPSEKKTLSTVLDDALAEFERDGNPGTPWREVLQRLRSKTAA